MEEHAIRDDAAEIAERPSPSGAQHVDSMKADVSERLRLQMQFAQTQKLESIQRLAGGVAHDFNNLLTVINGYSSLLLSQLPGGDRSRDVLQLIREAGERAAALTRQLLAFSHQQMLEPRAVNLNAVVHDAREKLGGALSEDVILTTVLAADLRPVLADAAQMSQVVINLAANARDAMPQGGRLTILTRNTVLDDEECRLVPDLDPGPYAVLEVHDTGHGMDEGTARRIFEPFFTTRAVGRGNGLGLATVHGIVRQLRGYVTVESRVGEGTTFRVFLPGLAEGGTVDGSATCPADVIEGRETILLVEDEDAVRHLTRVVLESNGYTVLDAAGGPEAIQLSRAYDGPIHLLISDVVMPRQGGRAVAEAILSDRPSCRVLFVSGYADDALLRHGAREADYVFLQKPFTLSSLHGAVREVLDAAGPGRARS